MNLTLEEIRLEEAVLESLPLTSGQIDQYKDLQRKLQYQFWVQINLKSPQERNQLESTILFLLRRKIMFVLRNFPENGTFEIFNSEKTPREMIATGKGKKQFWVDSNPEHLKELYYLEDTRKAVLGSKKLNYEQL